MQKYKFSVTCLNALFMKTAPDPLEHEKLCADASCPGRPRIYYMIRRSHRMQKHKFIITCPSALFMETYVFFIETALGPPEHEK
jgi:hypothetical protein